MRKALALLAFVLILPHLAGAQTITLPEENIFLGAWDIHHGGGPEPILADILNTNAYYAGHTHIFYRVLVAQNGSRKVLDVHKFRISEIGTAHQNYPGDSKVRIWAEAKIPSKKIDLPPGKWTVELWHISVPKPTALRYPNLNISDRIDWYVVARIEGGDECTRKVGGICWKEYLIGYINVTDKARLYKIYKIRIKPTSKYSKYTSGPFSLSSGRRKHFKWFENGFVIAVSVILTAYGLAIIKAARANAKYVAWIRARHAARERMLYWARYWARIRRALAEKRRHYERILSIEISNWFDLYTFEQKLKALQEMKAKYFGKVRKRFWNKIERLERILRKQMREHARKIAKIKKSKPQLPPRRKIRRPKPRHRIPWRRIPQDKIVRRPWYERLWRRAWHTIRRVVPWNRIKRIVPWQIRHKIRHIIPWHKIIKRSKPRTHTRRFPNAF